jgi:hypothetical protein
MQMYFFIDLQVEDCASNAVTAWVTGMWWSSRPPAWWW